MISLNLHWTVFNTFLNISISNTKNIDKFSLGIGKLANWLKGSGSALLCLRPLVLITGKYNWGDGDEA